MDPYASGIAWMIDAPHRRREERDRALHMALRRAASEGRPGLASRLRSLVGGPDRETAPVACCTNPGAA